MSIPVPSLISMSSEIWDWVADALKSSGSKAKPRPLGEARSIIAAAKRKFVQGNPRAWWMNPKIPIKMYGSKTYKLEEILPSQDRSYWFVPETEEGNLPVFDLTTAEIVRVLNECPYFEYYVVNKENRWFLAESDHNKFYVGCAHPAEHKIV